MNNCYCNTPGMVAPDSRYNKASACQQPPTQLTTKKIPKSRGTDAPGQPLAPVNGAYQNTIVYYEATGAVYIYDVNGVYTALKGDQLAPVIEELQAQMAALQANVNATNAAIDAETANRISAQTSLQNMITTLQSQLQAETTARESADTDLTNQLNELQGKVLENAQAITTEATARTEADAAIQGDLQTLQTSKQDELISGANIKTINGQTILGEGNIDVTSGGGADVDVVQSTGTSTTAVMSQNAVTEAIQENSTAVDTALDQLTSQVNAKQNELVSGTNIKTINGESLLGEGDLTVSGTSNSTYYSTLNYVVTPISSSAQVILHNHSRVLQPGVTRESVDLPTSGITMPENAISYVTSAVGFDGETTDSTLPVIMNAKSIVGNNKIVLAIYLNNPNTTSVQVRCSFQVVVVVPATS